MQSDAKYFARDAFRIIEELRGGACKQELTEKLNDVTRACQETGKSGSVTFTMKVSPQGAQFVVSDDIKTKVPVHSVQPTIMFADGDANLMRNNPRQMNIGEAIKVEDEQESVVVKQTGEVVRVEKE